MGGSVAPWVARSISFSREPGPRRPARRFLEKFLANMTIADERFRTMQRAKANATQERAAGLLGKRGGGEGRGHGGPNKKKEGRGRTSYGHNV